MYINSVNNQSFGAKIKISKPAMADFRDASILSTLGTSVSASGAGSSVPATDPLHHIHVAAKIVDAIFAGVGGIASAAGSVCMKFAHSLFKNGIKKSKIPS